MAAGRCSITASSTWPKRVWGSPKNRITWQPRSMAGASERPAHGPEPSSWGSDRHPDQPGKVIRFTRRLRPRIEQGLALPLGKRQAFVVHKPFLVEVFRHIAAGQNLPAEGHMLRIDPRTHPDTGGAIGG